MLLFSGDKCDTGWVSNLFLSHCFKQFNGAEELETYNAAERKCANLGARLVTMDTDHVIQIAQAVMEFYSLSGNCKYILFKNLRFL